MYYGYYTNSGLMGGCQQNSTGPPSLLQCPREAFGLDYNMPLAYFFTVGIAFFITCIILVYSISKSFGQSFHVDKPQGSLALKVFCSWDFRVIKKTSMKLQAENISTQLKVSPHSSAYSFICLFPNLFLFACLFTHYLESFHYFSVACAPLCIVCSKKTQMCVTCKNRSVSGGVMSVL